MCVCVYKDSRRIHTVHGQGQPRLWRYATDSEGAGRTRTPALTAASSASAVNHPATGRNLLSQVARVCVSVCKIRSRRPQLHSHLSNSFIMILLIKIVKPSSTRSRLPLSVSVVYKSDSKAFFSGRRSLFSNLRDTRQNVSTPPPPPPLFPSSMH